MDLQISNSLSKSFHSDLKKFWSERWFAVATIFLVMCILLFIVAPVLAVLLKSLGVGEGGLTLEYYKEFFQTPYYFNSLINSVSAAILSTLIVTGLSLAV
jgi:iron(III) transport system permease protein